MNAYRNRLFGLAGRPGRIQRALWLLANVVAVLALAGAITPAQPVSAETTLQCSDHTLNVTLDDDATDTYQVVGTLCSQGLAEGKTVQLLLHGAMMDRHYWDFPYQSEHYSYVRSATKRGYATFNLDRIGTGASDHPDGNLVDVAANAFVVHQVVEALRAGEIASPGFDKVIVVGHSLGSFTAVYYAGNFPGEADGIILTGYLHDLNWAYLQDLMGKVFYPATFDPKFEGQFPQWDYFTTVPGARITGGLYYLSTADPEVLAVDESLKQTATIGELNSMVALVYDETSLQIEGPVQMVVGQYDYTFCGNLVNCYDGAAVQNYEADFFSDSACLETAVINDAGHALNLQTNANAAYSQMLSWADRHVGSTADPAPQPCGAP